MLVSIALAPCVLRPPAAHSPSLIRSLSAMLYAVSQNGIIVCPDLSALRADLVHAAAAASGPAHRPTGVSMRPVLEAGAEVTAVPVYQWMLPEDTQPLRDAARELAGGRVDIAMFSFLTEAAEKR